MLLLVKRLALFFALLGGFGASQLPEFAQQYRQRLGGAIDEIHRYLAEFDAEARALAMTRAEGVARLKAVNDDFIRQRGEAVERMDARAQRLGAQLDAFTQAGPVGRLVAFARDNDPEIVRRAAEAFEPAIPTTREGFVAVAVGCLAGWGATRLAFWPLTRRRKRAPAPETA